MKQGQGTLVLVQGHVAIWAEFLSNFFLASYKFVEWSAGALVPVQTTIKFSILREVS